MPRNEGFEIEFPAVGEPWENSEEAAVVPFRRPQSKAPKAKPADPIRRAIQPVRRPKGAAAAPELAALLKQAIRLATARTAKEARVTAAVETVLVEVLAELLGGVG